MEEVGEGLWCQLMFLSLTWLVVVFGCSVAPTKEKKLDFETAGETSFHPLPCFSGYEQSVGRSLPPLVPRLCKPSEPPPPLHARSR
jgi:hypothetical protein